MFVLYTAILLIIVICLEAYFVSSIRNEQMEQSTSNVRIAEMRLRFTAGSQDITAR